MKYDEIKKIALSLFIKNGYDKTTVEQIASGAGIKKASLYFYIKSKEELFFDVLSDALDSHFKSMICETDNHKYDKAEDELFRVFYNVIAFHRKNEGQSKFLVSTLFANDEDLRKKIFQNKKMIRLNKEFANKISKIFERIIEQNAIHHKSIKDLTSSFYWFRNMCILKMISREKFFTDEEINTEWKFYWKGITAK